MAQKCTCAAWHISCIHFIFHLFLTPFSFFFPQFFPFFSHVFSFFLLFPTFSSLFLLFPPFLPPPFSPLFLSPLCSSSPSVPPPPPSVPPPPLFLLPLCSSPPSVPLPPLFLSPLLVTADHKVLSDNCESRNNHRYAVVVQDLATQSIQAYPCKTKTSQETQRSLQKFLEPDRKPKVIYTDNSLEFGKACEVLSWNHCTSTPHRSETNGIAERAVRRVKEGTSAVLLQSGLNEKLVGRFYGMLHLSAKRHRSIV